MCCIIAQPMCPAARRVLFMKRLLSLLILLGGLVACSSGCVLVDSAKKMGRYTKQSFKFRPGDYRDATEEPQDDWEFVGEEARGNQLVQRDPDQWWRKRVMSGKARSIERNLGFE